MMIRLYQDGDYEAITDCVEPFVASGDFSLIKDMGIYLTATEDDVPLGCGGIVMTGAAEGEVWLRLSWQICESPVTLMRILRAGFEIVKESFGISRLTARVQNGFGAGERMVKRFGFQDTNETMTIFDTKYRIYQWQTQ